MKFFSLLLCLIANSAFAYSVSKEIFETKDLKFIGHQGEGRFSSYLTMQVHYSPIINLFEHLKVKTGLSLITRGEAHITVITPIEFYDILAKNVSMNEINTIAQEEKIQASAFDIICLGQGSVKLDEKLESTFFIVVNSPALLKIRKKIKKLYVQKGGDPSSFKVEHFYPHITLGFSKRDLHESDGIIKDKKSCMSNIKTL